MKRIKYLFLAFLALLVLSACSSIDDDRNKIIIEPPEALRAEVYLSLRMNSAATEIVNTETGEVILSNNYSMTSMERLYIVLHDQRDKKHIASYRMDMQYEDFRKYIDEQLNIAFPLTYRDYYISFIATDTPPDEHYLYMPALTKDYDEAVCQMKNEQIFYSQSELLLAADYPGDDYVPIPGVKLPSYTVQSELERITGSFVFTVYDMDKIPAKANFMLSIEIDNLPSAFYLKTGETLGSKEMQAASLVKFPYRKLYQQVPKDRTVLAKYAMLNNHNLEATTTERGSFKFEYIEDVETEEVAKEIFYVFEEKNMLTANQIYMAGLFDKVDKKEDFKLLEKE